MENQKIIFFDFDGVIIDSYGMSLDILRLQNPSLTDDQFKHYFDGNVYEHIQESGRQEISFTDFFKSYRQRILDKPLIPSIDEIIITLSKQYRLVIISSTPTDIIGGFSEKYKLRAAFFDILGSDVGTNKVQKYNQVLHNLHSAPTQAIQITDTLGDIREAEQSGVTSIAVTWGYHNRETLEQGKPLIIVSDPRETITAVKEYFGD